MYLHTYSLSVERMADIIKLLPDSIANQIAAGEVIQRPSSMVKELLENAIDAEADEIQLIIKDSGKTLVQIIDNGKGMSETDARMAFERHATSKIASADDLNRLKTMGFRGEALASVAAIAQIDLRTKTEGQDLGSHIVIEGSKVKSQEFISTPSGTSLSVKNLFYNVPARRKFLKSDPVEFKHILDEFHRVALSYPEKYFSLHHNGNEIYHLQKGNLRQRIIAILGKSYNDKLVPVSETTDIIQISGFIGKAEAARKTKGDQFFFVNNRFIKSAYLNHAIRSAYEELITKDHYPLYVLFLEMDPSSIDINVHPTKQEIKFENERLVYNYLKVAARHAIGQYSLTPQLDFNQETFFHKSANPTMGGASTGSRIVPPPPSYTHMPEKPSSDGWEKVYESMKKEVPMAAPDDGTIRLGSKVNADDSPMPSLTETIKPKPYQIHNSYIVSQIKSGFMLIDQQYASERIQYEHHLETLESAEQLVQKELFPTTIELDQQHAEVLSNILDRVNQLGFDIKHFGGNSYVIQGIPVGLKSITNAKELIQQLIAQYVDNLELQLGIEENLARSMAYSSCIKRGQKLNELEMQSLIDLLFACNVPFKNPTGKKCFITMDLDELQKRFIG